MDLVQKVIEAIGGVKSAVCASFLSQLETYDEQIGIVPRTNTQQHRGILFPIANFLPSALILKISTGKYSGWVDGWGWGVRLSYYRALLRPSLGKYILVSNLKLFSS